MKKYLIIVALLFLSLCVVATNVSVSLTVVQRNTTLSQIASPSVGIIGQNTTFSCDYRFLGNSITGANCNITIDSITNNTIWDGTNYIFSNNLSLGTHTWNCSCEKIDYQSQDGIEQSYTVATIPVITVPVLGGYPTTYNITPISSELMETKIGQAAPVAQPQMLLLLVGMVGLFAVVIVWRMG